MPKPSAGMATLLRLAEREADQEARRLGQINQRIAEARDQFEKLAQYRDEYTNQMHGRLRTGIAVDELANLKSFILNLDGMVEKQRQSVLRLEALAQTQILALQTSQKKKKSFEVLIEKAQLKEKIALAKREQKQSDEYASNAGIYKSMVKART
jgi:flagellar protein FliJ